MSGFRAVWPVTDPSVPVPQLLDDALDDLPRVAARHGVRVTGRPRVSVQPGWQVAGSGGAGLVVVADTETNQPTDHDHHNTQKVPTR